MKNPKINELFKKTTLESIRLDSQFEEFDLKVASLVKKIVGSNLEDDSSDEELIGIITTARKEILDAGENLPEINSSQSIEEEEGQLFEILRKRIGGKILKYLILNKFKKEMEGLKGMEGESFLPKNQDDLIAVVGNKEDAQIVKHTMEILGKVFSDSQVGRTFRVLIEEILRETYAKDYTNIFKVFLEKIDEDPGVNQIFQSYL